MSAAAGSGGWRPLVATVDVDVGTPKKIDLPGRPPLAVFHLEGGEFCVTDDTCTHGEASLCDGFVEGDEVECPFHSGKFCVRDGRATAFPCEEPIRVYPVRLVDGQVCIEAES